MQSLCQLITLFLALLQDEVSLRAVEFVSNKAQLQEEQEKVEAQIVDLEAKLQQLQNTFRYVRKCFAYFFQFYFVPV